MLAVFGPDFEKRKIKRLLEVLFWEVMDRKRAEAPQMTVVTVDGIFVPFISDIW